MGWGVVVARGAAGGDVCGNAIVVAVLEAGASGCVLRGGVDDAAVGCAGAGTLISPPRAIGVAVVGCDAVATGGCVVNG